MSFKLDLENIPMLDDTETALRKVSMRFEEPSLDIENIRSTIHQSAREGRIDILEHELNQRPEAINFQDIDGMTPLHYAARYGNLKAIELLLSRGAEVRTKNVDGDTALHIASKYKHETWTDLVRIVDEHPSFVEDRMDSERKCGKITENIIKLLVNYGAIIDERNDYKLTPLHYAAMKSNLAAIATLVGLNANVNAEDLNEMTPLLLACVHGTEEVIEKLIKARSDVTKRDQRQNTVFHIVALRGEPTILKMMMKHSGRIASQSLRLTNNEGKTPLRLAVEGNHPETLKEILDIEKSFQTDWKRREKELIHFAASKGYLQVIKQLVEAGLDRNERDPHRCIPLHVAAQMNRKDVVEYLLEESNIEEPDDYGMTPLMLAVSQDSLDCVKVLIERGAQIWRTDNDERTVIYVGAKYNALNSVDYILSHLREEDALSKSIASRKSLRNIESNQESGMVNQTDRDQNSPMHIVASNGYLEMMRLLYAHGAVITLVNEDEETALHRAAHSGQTSAVRQLIEWDKRLILMKDEMGNSALHLAAKMGHDITTRVLLEAGADREARNSYQETPLIVAVEAGRLETTQQLISKGALVENPSDSRTVLHVAAERGFDNIARFLIQVGVTLDRRDDRGRTALDVACEHNKKEVARALVDTDDWKLLMVPNDVIPAGNRDKQGNRVETRKRDTPFRRLLAKFPELAAIVMDKCVERSKPDDDETLCIAYNFEYIDDTYMMLNEDKTEYVGNISPYDDEFKLKKDADEYAKNYDEVFKNHPLKMMANAEKLSLLSHPLSLALLKHKWNKLGRWVYYFGLSFYCVFIISLTQFVRHTRAPYNVKLPDDDNYYNSAYFDDNESCPAIQLETPNPFWKTLIFLFASTQLLKEIFQLYQRKLSYLYNWENWVECFIYSTAILIVIDFTECSKTSGVRQNWQWLLAALCIWIGWINLLFMIRKMPKFGIYVVMFVDIVKTFFRFFPVFVLFIIAFSTSFYVILQNRPEFSTIFLAPLKTTVMMIGEFEFTGIFFGDNSLHEEKMFGTAHATVAYVIFFFFSIIMTILLMNLLVGLAVDDIKGVQEKAELKRLAMQVDLCLQIEASAYLLRRRRRYATSRYGSYPYGKLNQGSWAACWSQFRKRFGLNKTEEAEMDALYEYESEITSELRTNLQLQRNQLQTLQENVDVMYEKQIDMVTCSAHCRSNFDPSSEQSFPCGGFNFRAGRSPKCEFFPATGANRNMTKSLKIEEMPTFYYQKVCLRVAKRCEESAYMFDVKKGYRLEENPLKIINVTSERECMEQCIADQCASFGYHQDAKRCSFYNTTRRLSSVLKDGKMDYYENNCLHPSSRCPNSRIEFFVTRKSDVPSFGLSLGVKSVRSCMQACINAGQFFCRSIQFDPTSNECFVSDESSDMAVPSNSLDIYEPYCVKALSESTCNRPYSFEKSITSKLSKISKVKDFKGISSEKCLEECLSNTECNSVNYNVVSRICELISTKKNDGSLISDENYDFYELTCPHLSKLTASSSMTTNVLTTSSNPNYRIILRNRELGARVHALPNAETTNSESISSALLPIDPELIGLEDTSPIQLPISSGIAYVDPKYVAVTAECQPQGINITFDILDNVLKYTGVVYASERFDQCRVFVKNSSSFSMFVPRPKHNSWCNAVEIGDEMSSIVIMSNDRIIPHDVTTKDDLFYQISCKYDNETEVHKGIVVGGPSPVMVQSDKIEEKISLEISKNGKIVESVYVGESLMATVKSNMSAEGFRVVDCTAHRVGGSGPPASVNLIADGCALLPSIMSPMRITPNGWQSSLSAFRIDGSEQIDIACILTVCQGKCPELSCPSRLARSIPGDEHSIRVDRRLLVMADRNNTTTGTVFRQVCIEPVFYLPAIGLFFGSLVSIVISIFLTIRRSRRRAERVEQLLNTPLPQDEGPKYVKTVSL
ncbi:unnamed protein product [Caenorhabditis bovis]|uniref:Ion transport domain-containing protein n=1 Tax=Caenorhabditis bovis TaxID=2654633 RepID=A0A8S1FBN8_9PELO|nr:unnamed protein product [Caenorhabditis bovis]